MKDIEVHQFKSKLEAKRGVFTSFNLLEESEWSCMLEKAKVSSKAYNNKEDIYTSNNSIFSFLSSKKLSAALSFALVVVLLASFALSSSYGFRNNNNRTLRQRRSVPVINVSSRYI